MNRLRILITSSYYWPEPAGNAPYVTGLAEHLAAQGHDVAVATGFPHYPAWASTPRRLAQHEVRNNVVIRRRWHYVPHAQSAFTRGVYEATLWAFGATALPLTRPDVVVGVVPTLAAAALARLAGVVHRRPYGLIFQDIVGLAATQSGIEGGHRIAGVVGRGELRLARRAAAIAVIADGFGRYFERHGVDRDRIRRLRNWSQDVTPVEARAETRARLGWPADSFICVHAGNMGHKQGLENVLAAAERLRGGNTLLVLAGDGNERERLEQIARSRELENVLFLPPSPPGEYEALLRAADVLLVNQRASVGEMSLASKLTSYFAAGRPVLAAVAPESETAREVVAAGAGMLAPPDDPQALADALTALATNDTRASEYRQNALRYTSERLTQTAVLREYEAFVRDLAGSRR